MKVIIFLSFFIINVFSDNLDLNKFDDRVEVVEDIRALILYEEKLAIAYERYLENKYKFPTQEELKANVNALSLKKLEIKDGESTFGGNSKKITHKLPESIKNDSLLKELYNGNKYRDRTYFYKDSVYFVIEDSFVNHLFDLIKFNKDEEIETCSIINGIVDETGKQNCNYNNHIYIGVTKISENKPSEYNMVYFIDNFKTGPIVFDPTKLDLLSEILESIPIGAILYDFDGNKFIKTKNGIKDLQ